MLGIRNIKVISYISALNNSNVGRETHRKQIISKPVVFKLLVFCEHIEERLSVLVSNRDNIESYLWAFCADGLIKVQKNKKTSQECT